MSVDDPKVEAERKAWLDYKRKHDAYGRPAESYPQNRKGRRDMERTWKGVAPGVYHRGG